jgi:ubiquinone/menaquinone biosynthesis C-methylase UbiE
MTRTPDFNGLARLYRWMEIFSFGPWLAMTRRTFIEQLAGSRRALVLGDGDGRFTEQLLRANHAVQVDAVDASSAMLQALLRRTGEFSGRVQVHLEDVRGWIVPAPIAAVPYDLVATHFFLDCLTTREVNLLAAKIRLAASPGALWVVSEFAIPAGWFGRLVARPVVAGLYFSFGLLTGLRVRKLPDYAAAMGRAGFMLKARQSRLGGLLVAELWCAATPIEA